MKKYFENIVVATVVVFFLLSISYNIYLQIYSKTLIQEKRDQINQSENTEIVQETVELSGEFTVDEALEMNKLIYIYDISNANIKIISISVIFGVIIATIYSSSENNSLKEVSTYILTFIFGHVLFNAFYSLIDVFVFGNIGIVESFTMAYMNMATKTIVGYIFIYLAIAFWFYISKSEKLKEAKELKARNKASKTKKIEKREEK